MRTPELRSRLGSGWGTHLRAVPAVQQALSAYILHADSGANIVGEETSLCQYRRWHTSQSSCVSREGAVAPGTTGGEDSVSV